MERLIIALFLFAASNSLFAQGSSSRDHSSLEWGSPIVFKDFKSRPDLADTAAARISVSIQLGYYPGRDGVMKFKAAGMMERNESWIKEQYKNVEILKHEQGHFDIAHIFAKKLEKNLKEKRFTAKDINIINAVYDNFLAMMNEVQVSYDEETHGGLNRGAQARWKKFIEGELKLVHP